MNIIPCGNNPASLDMAQSMIAPVQPCQNNQRPLVDNLNTNGEPTGQGYTVNPTTNPFMNKILTPKCIATI